MPDAVVMVAGKAEDFLHPFTERYVLVSVMTAVDQNESVYEHRGLQKPGKVNAFIPENGNDEKGRE